MPVQAFGLTRLRLSQFRSWPALSFEVTAPLVVITGENGAGKTNLLEAISLLGPGRGLRGARLADLGRRNATATHPWAAAGRFRLGETTFDLGTGTAATEGQPAPDRRQFRLDNEPVRSAAALAGRVATVWLTPQMDRLLADGAAERRRFLDRLAWTLEPQHARALAAYERALLGRRRLLADTRRGRAVDPAWLAALEDGMARHGSALAAGRRSLVAQLNATLAAGITGAFPSARLTLACPVASALADAPALAVEDAWRTAWAEARARDAAAGTTGGPHRADLVVTHLVKEQPAATCSTGEQKALLIAIVLAHAALIATARGFAPLLLLDEVAAHLDAIRRESLFAALSTLPAQTFLTGTDATVFAPLRQHAQYFRASPGRLLPGGDFGSP